MILEDKKGKGRTGKEVAPARLPPVDGGLCAREKRQDRLGEREKGKTSDCVRE